MSCFQSLSDAVTFCETTTSSSKKPVSDSQGVTPHHQEMIFQSSIHKSLVARPVATFFNSSFSLPSPPLPPQKIANLSLARKSRLKTFTRRNDHRYFSVKFLSFFIIVSV